MKNSSYENLVFRRQYLISKGPVTVPFKHEKHELVSGYVLYRHPDLVFAEHQGARCRVILLGDILDWEKPTFGNAEILKQLGNLTFAEILETVPDLGGRYALLVIEQDDIHILNDTGTCRKVYYHEGDSDITLASNPNLLAEICGAKLSTDTSLLEYQKSTKFLNAECTYVLDVTAYEGIHNLIPNHYLTLGPFKIKRFWPAYALDEKSKKDIVAECADIIKGFVEAVYHRYPLMIPITAGFDSRVLLAASREWSKDIYYFLNYYEILDSTADGHIPKKVLEDVGLEFHLNKIPECKNEDFLKAYKRNQFQYNPIHVNAIYNFGEEFPDHISLPGNGITVIKSKFRTSTENPGGMDIARVFEFENYEFAVKAYTKWLEDLGTVAKETNTFLDDLIVWEDQVSAWHAQLQQCKDISQEDLVIFNSAYLMSRAMTYDNDRRTIPYFDFHRDLIKYMWPELMKHPFNPSFKNRVIDALGKLGLYKTAVKAKNLIKRFI